jgi:hypothetical protein
MCKSNPPRIEGGPTRCPYCHAHVDLQVSPWVACAGCLARHHADCWLGQGGCAGCLGQRALFPASSLGTVRERLRRGAAPPRRSRALVLGALLLTAQLGAVALGLALLGDGPRAELAELLGMNRGGGSAAPAIDAAGLHHARADLRAVRDELVRRDERRRIAQAIWDRERAAVRAQAELAAAREAKENARAELAEVREDNGRLRDELKAERKYVWELQLLLAMRETPSPRPAAIDLRLQGYVRMPAIDGVVVTAESAGDAPILLSVGRDDGVELGYGFSVYRGSKFVGRVVVEHVGSDAAACRVLFLSKGQTIQPGDAAATRLD